MNDAAHKAMVQKAVKPKFRGNQKLKCKTHTIYPDSAEREYQRASAAYMVLLNHVVKEHLPTIQAAAKTEKQSENRRDGVDDLMKVVEREFMAISLDFEKKAEQFGLRQKLESLANMTRKLSIREWKRAVKATLGIDLLDDYYLGEFYQQAMQEWIDQNVSLISTLPNEALNDMRNIVSQGFKTGRTTTSIVKEIQRTYRTKKSSARLIARDQLAKLNSQLTQKQQQDAGVDEYTWSTSGDGRVRDTHRSLNKKRFRWDDPPVVTEPGKPIRRCHPGEDYQCRCVALPVFNIETVTIPVSDSMKGGD